VTFEVRRDLADDAAGILVADGALGCEVRRISRGKRSRNDTNGPVLLRAYFDQMTPAALRRLQAKLEAAHMLVKDSVPEHSFIEDPGWATMWQERFAPLPIGRCLLVVPPWQREHAADRIELVIQPGQGFGTGHHPSTSGTLEAIEQLCGNRRIGHALDVGTGSGILAIAMAKLGVAAVTALDTDPAAVANAKENVRLNRAAAKIHVSTTPLSSVHGRFSLITANILSSTLIGMAPDLKARLRHRGYLVLSGILRREAAAVARAYLPELTAVENRNHDTWTTLIFQK
jgi:ribosomal protein L11 methyltransferase